MTVTVAQLGARMHYAVPRILHSAGYLERLYTDICATRDWPRWLRMLPRGLRQGGIARLLGRVPEGIPADRIFTFPTFGLQYALRLRKAHTGLDRNAAYLWAGARFDRLVVAAGFGAASTVYGFNTASEILFQDAARRRTRMILEQTIAPRVTEAKLLDGAADVADPWRETIRDASFDEFASRERREWELADRILCPSEFVREAVVECGADRAKCLVVPYGVDTETFIRRERATREVASRERVVLFVGLFGLRKGAPYLLRAMSRLEALPLRCRIVGPTRLDLDFVRSQCPANVEFVGPIPRQCMAREYARADIFCLPSLCEGSATATYEALAAGLPVVTTPNSGSIVRDGVEGFVVPAGDAVSLAGALERLCRDKALRRSMGQAAGDRSRYGSLSAYRERLLPALGLP